MPLEIVYGQSRDRIRAQALAEKLATVVDTGTVYLGYPVLATADERVEVDALLVSIDHGLVAFLIADAPPADDTEWEETVAAQDRLYAVLESHLGRHDTLRRGRRLAFDPHTATVFSADPAQVPDDVEGFYGGLDAVPAWVESRPPIDTSVERAVQAALQRVTTIKPAKRRASVERADSRGAVLKEIEKDIANLDRWQKTAAIESPDGPQRIRGLAGQGRRLFSRSRLLTGIRSTPSGISPSRSTRVPSTSSSRTSSPDSPSSTATIDPTRTT